MAIAVQFNTDNFAKLKRYTHDYVLEMARVVFGAPRDKGSPWPLGAQASLPA
jgi:hypothetical protein